MFFKSSNGAKLGILGDQAFAEYTFGAEEEQALTWLSAGDFVETTDLSDHLAAHLTAPLTATAYFDRTDYERRVALYDYRADCWNLRFLISSPRCRCSSRR